MAQIAGLTALPEGYASTGVVNLDFELSGTPQKPSASGTITMIDGTLRIPGIRTPLTEIAVIVNDHGRAAARLDGRPCPCYSCR